ncbi:MAG TPA: hypothetical protein VN774_02330 [Candidatus Limnocylindrales bacterium]|nr:hypothetical protein [Candidatus Limnocylindrales bacterium]
MACERFEKALIEEAIEPGGNADLASHLANCPDCSEELALQRGLQERITAGVGALVAEGPSPVLLARVRHQIAAERAPRGFPWLQWAMAGLAIAACAVLWYAFRPQAQVRTPQAQVVNAPAQIQPSTQQVPVLAAPAAKRPNSVANHLAVSRPPINKIPAEAVEKYIPAQTPEVIVPPGQREAVLRLVNALQSGRVDAASLLRPAQTGEFALLKIAPIEVKPLLSEESKQDLGKQENH